jgi:two-component system LytT family response regulator
MVIQALIADDEALARRKLRDFLASDPDVEIVGEAATGPETVHLVRERSPQVVFLDVAMPGQNGFDVLSELSASDADSPLPRIVFTTAYDHYALRAFDTRAVDYLLKPFTADRLRLALQRAREEILTATRQNTANPHAGDSLDRCGGELRAHLHGKRIAPSSRDHLFAGREA